MIQVIIFFGWLVETIGGAQKLRSKKACKACHKEFWARQRDQYCSRSCATKGKWLGGNYSPQRSFEHKRPCSFCGTEFESAAKRNKFCSRKCSGKALFAGPVENAFKTRQIAKPRLDLECKHCGKSFTQNRSSRVETYCSQLCRNVANSARARTAITPESFIRARRKQIETIAANPLLAKGPHNQRAKIWRLRSPRGEIFAFRNLAEFIRSNSSLFDESDIQWRKQKGGGETCRAYGGLCQLADRLKTPCGGWKGWSAHSQIERLHGGDLLNRVYRIEPMPQKGEAK
jgi:endogenous inhibitor of DNA gyrase (YacG/DUF329 family)